MPMTFFVQTFYREFYHIGSEEAISNWSGKYQGYNFYFLSVALYYGIFSLQPVRFEFTGSNLDKYSGFT
jgi:hypothetical protein